MTRSALRLVAVLSALSLAGAATHAQKLEIHTLNVGRGDCALILSPSGMRVLVDTGKPGDGNSIVIPYLQSLGVTDLDYILISHYDGDHIGGVPELIAAGYSPIAVLDRGDFDAEMHQTWADYVAAIGSLRQQITVGMVLDLGAGVTMKSWIANGVIDGGPSINVLGKVENAKSAGWQLEYGDFDYGTFGDISGLLESPLGPLLGDLDVYKASHHGSNTSSTNNWINAVTPDVTFVSSGTDSSNPKQATINVITKSASMRWIYMTNDSNGLTRGGRPAYAHMVLRTDGTTYTVEGPTVPLQHFLCDEYTGQTAQPGDVALSEFMLDPTSVSDLEGEYFELTNLTDQFLSMKGWTIRDAGSDSITIASNALLAPRQTLVVAAQGDVMRNGGVTPGMVWPNNSFLLDNSTDRIIVENELGTKIIDYNHTIGSVPGTALEWKDLYDPSKAFNLALAAHAYGQGDLGTPGTRNDSDTTPWVPNLKGVFPAGSAATGGGWVTLQGFDLGATGSATVYFGRKAAPIVVVQDQHTLRVRVPSVLRNPFATPAVLAGLTELVNGIVGSGLTVPVTVLTANGASKLGSAFTYLPITEAPTGLPK